jgi:cytochrome d ubiquinol oxidase subunit I
MDDRRLSPVAAGAVASTLLLFFLVYNILLLAFFWYGWRVLMEGPNVVVEPNAVRPGLGQAAPAILSAPPAVSPPVSAAERSIWTCPSHSR